MHASLIQSDIYRFLLSVTTIKIKCKIGLLFYGSLTLMSYQAYFVNCN